MTRDQRAGLDPETSSHTGSIFGSKECLESAKLDFNANDPAGFYGVC